MRTPKFIVALIASGLFIFGIGATSAIADSNPPAPPAADCTVDGDEQDAVEAATEVGNAATEVEQEAETEEADDENGDQQDENDQSDEQNENDCDDGDDD